MKNMSFRKISSLADGLFVSVAIASQLLLPSVLFAAGTGDFNVVIVSNVLRQMGSSDTSYFMGNLGVGITNPTTKLHVAGGLTVDGAMAVPKQGDISMGTYTNGGYGTGSTQTASLPQKSGYISGCWVQYNSGTSVVVTAGEGYCNGNYFNVSTNTTHIMTTLASTNIFHYIYIDDSASAYPSSPVIIDAITEPTYSLSFKGWYSSNNADRCIGVVYAPTGTSTIAAFQEMKGKTWVLIAGGPLAQLGTAISNAWTTPQVRDCDAVTPTNAKAVLLQCYYSDANGSARLHVTTKEVAAYAGIDYTGTLVGGASPQGSYSMFTAWMPLGASRKIKYLSHDGDDNQVYIYVLGWEIDR